MKTYSMTNDPWQGFTIVSNGLEVKLSIYWVPLFGWVADLDGVAHGVAIQPMIPIFKQYNYAGVFFATAAETITRDGMIDSVVVSASEEELSGKSGVLEIDAFGNVILI
jgi:hypothetical protein